MLDWGFNMKKDDEDVATMVAIVILAIVGFIVGPILTLLALNTLFPALAIPYTLGTWAATFFLFAVIRAKVKNK